MKKDINPKKAIAMLLILSFAVSIIMTSPTTKAQAAPTQKTYAFVEAVPNPVGVGQQVEIRFGILQALPDIYSAWTGMTVTVVKPNGDKVTLGPFKSDATGGTTTYYTPDQVGTYKLTTNFPQQTMPADMFDMERGAFIPKGTVMQASTSRHNQPCCTAKSAPNLSDSTSSDRLLVTSSRRPTQRMVFNFGKLGE